MVTMMRKMRHNVPDTNPRLHIDALPTQGRRVVVSNDPRPRPAAKRKVDAKPTTLTTPTQPKRRNPIEDARDRTAAHRDEALAQIRKQFKGGRK